MTKTGYYAQTAHERADQWLPDSVFERPAIVGVCAASAIFSHGQMTEVMVTLKGWGFLRIRADDARAWRYGLRMRHLPWDCRLNYCPWKFRVLSISAPKGAVLRIEYSNFWRRAQTSFSVPRVDESLPTNRVEGPIFKLGLKPVCAIPKLPRRAIRAGLITADLVRGHVNSEQLRPVSTGELRAAQARFFSRIPRPEISVSRAAQLRPVSTGELRAAQTRLLSRIPRPQISASREHFRPSRLSIDVGARLRKYLPMYSKGEKTND